MQLHEQIHHKRAVWRETKPRSNRRQEVERDLKKLMTRQLKREIKKARAK